MEDWVLFVQLQKLREDLVRVFASRQSSWTFRPLQLRPLRCQGTPETIYQQTNRYFSPRAEFFFGIFNAERSWVRISAWLLCTFWLFGAKPNWFMFSTFWLDFTLRFFCCCAPILSPVSELGLACLILFVLGAFSVEWAHQLIAAVIITSG